MEADAPHLLPQGRTCLQECFQAARCRGFSAHPFVQLRPETPQDVRGEVFGTGHWRGFQQQLTDVLVRKRGQGFAVSRTDGAVASCGQGSGGEIMPVGKVPGKSARRRMGCQLEEPRGFAVGKCGERPGQRGADG